MDTVIKVEHLSKQYRIGAREGYRTFRETLVDAVKAPLQGLSKVFNRQSAIKNRQSELIWALKDVSFEVKQGEVVGIIGRNGAGKSTLLKILSRITEPTEGRVELRGRVGSLLEVGTGFHPELTGHENIYLYGAILGMDRWEITRKFDEIVAFAELEKFIDTPVKKYSSGMYMRLAFAVAAHLEPEILLVDEVLAVGDAAFQKKCLGKIGDVSKHGQTVLFVSHQMNAIRRLCDHCIWMEDGHVQEYARTVEVVSSYEASVSAMSLDSSVRGLDPSVPVRFLRWEIMEPKAEKANVLNTTEALTFRTVVQTNKQIQNADHGIALWNSDGQLLWAWAVTKLRLAPGLNHLVYLLPGLPLRPGVYQWQVSLYEDGGLLDNWFCQPELVIATKSHGHHLDQWTGLLNLSCSLRIEHSE